MRRTDALSHELAAVLADRLDAVVPPGFRVEASGPDVTLRHHGVEVGGSGALRSLDDDHDGVGLPEERAHLVAVAVVSGVQDDVCRVLTEPWPVRDGAMADPDVRWDGSTVTIWFGEETNPVLVLRPFPTARPA